MDDTAILEALVSKPNAYQLIEKVQSLLEKEKDERRKFHELIHENMKAEFINGEVIMHSPVKREHWKVSMNLSASVHQHVKDNKLGEVGVEKVMVHLTRNDYEPDICFFDKEKTAQFYPGQLLFPAPDFIVEILSPRTEKNDRNIKMQDYAAHGVTEYWIIDPIQQSVEQYLLADGSYHLQVKLIKEGTLYSKAIANYQVQLQDIF